MSLFPGFGRDNSIMGEIISLFDDFGQDSSISTSGSGILSSKAPEFGYRRFSSTYRNFVVVVKGLDIHYNV